MPVTDRFDLSGRTALVTGASSGLGRHFALTLARAGAHVALAARRRERLEETAEEIENAGGKAVAVELDVTDASAVAPAFDAAEAALGPVTILVTAAGVPSGAFFTDTGDAEWRGVMEVNIDGVYRTAREGARRMQTNGQGGTIVNIASIFSFGVSKTLSAYATSKAAVAQMTKAMALELARDVIRVNALAPGYFPTEMNADFLASDAGQRLIAKVPQKRAGALEDLEGPLLLLASDAGTYMTGSVVPVDGGALLSMS